MAVSIDNIPTFTLPLSQPSAAVIAAVLKDWDGNFNRLGLQADVETKFMIELFADLLLEYSHNEDMNSSSK